MNQAEVSCDKCHAVTNMEQFNGTTNYRMPKYWVTVFYLVSVHGLQGTENKEVRTWLKDNVQNKLPHFHLCPTCAGKGEYEKTITKSLEESCVIPAENTRRRVQTEEIPYGT